MKTLNVRLMSFMVWIMQQMLKDIFINCKQWHFENDETCGGCKMLAKNHKIMKNTQNIKNDYTKYSNIKLDQTQYIVAETEFE